MTGAKFSTTRRTAARLQISVNKAESALKILIFTVIAATAMIASTTTWAAGDAAKGKEIYNTICVVCHGPDPSKDGPLGPAITGASEELLEARIMRAQYPDGYTPKRNTTMMPPFPQYKDNIADMAEFLK